MNQRAWPYLLLLPVLLFCVGASWNERDDATGSWNGLRLRLEENYGLHIDIDYTGESFDHDSNDDPSYRGNLDLVLTIEMKKLGLMQNGTFFVYGQHAHGGGVSDELRLLMPVSNLEAETFTQLSEFWLYKQIGPIRLRLGKQDANRDFGNPRFPGNFVNSSFGVMPGIPMPSFPAPGLGAVVFANVTGNIELRGGIYEGTPKIGSFGESAFAENAGVFTIASMVLQKNLYGNGSSVSQLGVWNHTGLSRSGIFGLYDLFLPINSSYTNSHRTAQFFVRGSWSPKILEPADVITQYIGGGVTAHGFIGKDNTIGLGGAWAHTEAAGETVLEAFFKLREIAWLTFEPDVQLYFTPKGRHFVFGLRTRLKL